MPLFGPKFSDETIVTESKRIIKENLPKSLQDLEEELKRDIFCSIITDKGYTSLYPSYEWKRRFSNLPIYGTKNIRFRGLSKTLYQADGYAKVSAIPRFIIEYGFSEKNDKRVQELTRKLLDDLLKEGFTSRERYFDGKEFLIAAIKREIKSDTPYVVNIDGLLPTMVRYCSAVRNIIPSLGGEEIKSDREITLSRLSKFVKLNLDKNPITTEPQILQESDLVELLTEKGSVEGRLYITDKYLAFLTSPASSFATLSHEVHFKHISDTKLLSGVENTKLPNDKSDKSYVIISVDVSSSYYKGAQKLHFLHRNGIFKKGLIAEDSAFLTFDALNKALKEYREKLVLV